MRAPLLPAPSEDAPSASAAPGCRGEAASKTTPACPRGGAAVMETGGRGVLIPRQSPDPGRSVPGFVSDSALSSIQSLVYRRASGASAIGRLSSWAMRKEALPRRVWQRSIPSWSPMPSGTSTNRGARSPVDTQLRQSRPHIPGPVEVAWSTQVRGRSDCVGSPFSWPASGPIALWASCSRISSPLPGQLAIQGCG